MKRVLAFTLALLMVFVLAACGGKPEPAPSGADTSEPGASQQASSGQGAGEAPEIENQVDLSLDAAHYEQDGTIAVTLDFSKLNQDEAIIAIVASDMEHNAAVPTYDNAEELRYLADFSELPFYMSAPLDKDGVFDVRVYSSAEGGEELASVTIAVGSATLPE